MLQVANLSKKFKTVEALKGVTLEFERNKITGLIGYNGSGKTTTFNIICNYIEKYDGQVLVDGAKLDPKDCWKISMLSGDTEEDNNDKVVTQLLYFANLYGFAKKEALVHIEALAKIFYFDFKLTQTIKSLSKGNRQKVKLAQTFLNPHAQFFLLDEPFDGLDPIMVKKISRYIVERKKDATIIITSHQMNVIDDICDEFFVLKKGELVAQKLTLERLPVIVEVNREIDVQQFTETFIKKTVRTERKNQVILFRIEDFVELSKILVTHKDYIFHSLKQKSLAESVFEQYDDEAEQYEYQH